MKRKILIIAFAYPPSSLIAGKRPYTWAKSLAESGYEVTVITRHWNGTEKKPSEVEASLLKTVEECIEDGIKVIRLPFINDKYNKHISPAYTGIRKFYSAIENLLSYNTAVNPYNYHTLKHFLEIFLQNNAFDYLIVSSPPTQYLKLGHWISSKYSMPFWADFRDYLFLFDTVEDLRKKKDLVGRLRLSLFMKQTRKYLSKASVISSVSMPIINDLGIKEHVKTVIILNGYDGEKRINGSLANKFTISLLGTIYDRQDVEFMIEGLNIFLKEKGSDVEIKFVGTGSDEDLKKKIKTRISHDGVQVLDWMPTPAAMEIVYSSHVLYYIGWRDLKGIYSGKIFEYLGASRNILVAPDDHDVVSNLISYTGSGKLADSTEQMAQCLDEWYQEWQQTGTVTYYGDCVKISEFSRAAQAKKVVSVISDHFSQANIPSSISGAND